MKACFKCGAEKPLIDFYKHSKMVDGHVNKCKECNKKDVNENRELKYKYYLNYDRNRHNSAERNIKATQRNKLKYPEDVQFKESVLHSRRKWLEKNTCKRKAQIASNNAVRDGKLERKTSCEHCGTDKKKLQKHHWSYLEEHWLDVIWLCTTCHGAEHKRLNEIGRDPDSVLI